MPRRSTLHSSRPEAGAPRVSRAGRRGLVRPVLLVLGSLAASVVGCQIQRESSRPAGNVRPAEGIVVRRARHGLSAVRVIDVDLGAPGVRIEIAARDVAVREGKITARALTVPELVEGSGAAAGINGGFFGESVGAGEYKEIVGLLKREGKVRAAAPSYPSKRTGGRYSRSAFGLTEAGWPDISWVTSREGDPQALFRHPAPDIAGPGRPWNVRQALACGPRLIRNGQAAITFKGERLASPGTLPRTFLGYGGPAGSPPHLVLCAADALEFEECARFLMEYFRREHGGPCSDAMALDGGASTQAAWREGGKVVADPDPGTTVPTAILVHGRR